MIDMCKAFSIDDECSVFCSLFQVNTENRELLKLALQNLRTAAVGRTKSNQLKESGVKDLRNMMFHDFLTLDSRDFEVLVACAKQLLEAIRVVLSIVGDDRRSDYAVQALAEIEDLVHRDVTVEKLSDSERQVFERRNEQMLEEFERIQEEHKLFKAKLGRKFDSFAVCLKSDIQNDLKEGIHAAYRCINAAHSFHTYIRQSNRQNWRSRDCLPCSLSGPDARRQIVQRKQTRRCGKEAGAKFAHVIDTYEHCSHVLHCIRYTRRPTVVATSFGICDGENGAIGR